MTDFEKAIRYLCLFETDDMEIMAGRYLVIQDIVQGDLEEEKNMQKNMKKWLTYYVFSSIINISKEREVKKK